MARRVHHGLIGVGVILSLLWVAYFVGVAALMPAHLRQAASRVGLRLDVASVRSLYPGELRVRDLQLEVPSIGVLVFARQVIVAPSWRGLVSPAPLVASARASQVELRWSGGSLRPLEVHVRRPVAPPGSSDEGLIEIEGARARWQTVASAATLTLWGSFDLRYDEFEPGRSARVVLEHGMIDVSEVTLDEMSRRAPSVRASDGRLRMHAMLRVENATLDTERGIEAAGSVYVNGEDASIGLDLAAPGEPVRRMFAGLEGHPFVLEAASRACPRGIAFDGIRSQSGLTSVSGALRWVPEGWSGALQVRRGSSSLGLSIEPGSTRTLLSPEPFWLDVERARLHDVCTSIGL